ncbi:type II secretion system protein [Candidatus Peregrinibacteria bacterium]|nr:type II secretion system protein [Candidatus Peregrinibacteria bacterium]
MVNINKKGFTLIELLIVIGIISILAGIVLVAVNPAQQFGKANDSERKSEIGTILSAVYQYQTSPTARGALPECLLGAAPGAATAIPECDDPLGAGGAFDGAVQLGTPVTATTYDCSTTLVPSYLREIPMDPSSTYSAAATGYYICQDTSGDVSRVYVLAVGAEVYTDDGGCTHPDGSGDPVMCVSG